MQFLITLLLAFVTAVSTTGITVSASGVDSNIICSIRDAMPNGGPSYYKASSPFTLGDETYEDDTQKQFKWANSGPLQINLERSSNIMHGDLYNPVAGTVEYWNGDRSSNSAFHNANGGDALGHMTSGNWIDPEQYTLTLKPSGNLSVCVINQGCNHHLDVQWKLEGWGHTILYGPMGQFPSPHDGSNVTSLLIKDGVYHQFPADLQVNPQEAFTGTVQTEVLEYSTYSSYDEIHAGSVFFPTNYVTTPCNDEVIAHQAQVHQDARDNIQADVDQNEADADAAIQSLNQTVSDNKAATDAAIANQAQTDQDARAAIQADVDQNEADADAAIASNAQADAEQAQTDQDARDNIQADVDQNEADADAAIQSLTQTVSDNKAATDTAIANQASTDAAARQELSGRIGSTETLITTESAARQSADTELSSKIDAETQARQSGDAELSSKVDAEAQARQSADAALSSKVDNEKTRAEAKEEELNAAISEEESRAKDAEQQNKRQNPNPQIAGWNPSKGIHFSIGDFKVDIDLSFYDTMTRYWRSWIGMTISLLLAVASIAAMIGSCVFRKCRCCGNFWRYLSCNWCCNRCCNNCGQGVAVAYEAVPVLEKQDDADTIQLRWV